MYFSYLHRYLIYGSPFRSSLKKSVDSIIKIIKNFVAPVSTRIRFKHVRYLAVSKTKMPEIRLLNFYFIFPLKTVKKCQDSAKEQLANQ
jgi:hypothetical protein